MNKADRNAFCPCGSGKKYKHCCLRKTFPAAPQSNAEVALIPMRLKMTMDYIQQGKLNHAQSVVSEILKLRPAHPEALHCLGLIFHGQGDDQKSIEYIEQSIAAAPIERYFSNLANIYQSLGQLDKATKNFEQALALSPSSIDLVTVIGLLKMQMGRPDEAVKYYRQALSIKSDNFNTFTCMLLALQYSTAFSAEDIYIAHQQFGQRVQSKQGNASVIHLNDRAVGRRLKVGYVSGDFRNHAVAFFIEPILANHDRSQFEVYCYYNLSTEDDQTKKLAILADHWLICSAMSDEQLASRIREDGIDILIDLSGHTSHNRLPMFARKPAPVQITWIGYAGTTGLAAMDYRITDAYMDPPGLTERYHSETLIRLPQTSTLYQPTSGCPKVNALPALKSEQFVFASLNNLTKVNQGVVNLWSKILTAVPRAKLMLANMSEEAIEKRVVAMFEQCGIGPERLILKPRMPLLDYLALHHQIDVALDPFPYTGGTTSVHSLWMGVPVITLAGQRTVSRVGASILSQLGVTDLIVHSEDEYLQLAIKMTQNLPALSQLRQSLRARMENPTGERVDVTHALEAAYRDVWNTWCAQ